MTLLYTISEETKEAVDLIAALRDHDASFIQADWETCDKLEEFREDLFRIDRQRDELIRLNPTKVLAYREQHQQAEQEIARRIAKLNIPGVKAV